MTYTVTHPYVDQTMNPTVTVATQGGMATVHCAAQGSLPIRFPGKFHIYAAASYFVRVHVDDVGGPHGGGLHGGWQVQTKTVPLTVHITTPDGQPFTADHVTLNDLRRFRDLRGTSQGSWSYQVSGHSDPIPVEPGQFEVSAGDGHLTLTLEETVTSQSAPPLVNDTLGAGEDRRYTFDLYRVGMFEATAQTGALFGWPTDTTMKLFDPDGAQVAVTEHGPLTFPVNLQTLEKSRDAHGHVRPWSLEVVAASPLGSVSTIFATVIATTRIHTQTLKSRIDTLIGVGGNKILIYGEMQQERLLARLKILDNDSAGTIDLLGLLDKVLKRVKQDDGVDIADLKANVPYNLANRSRDLGYELHVSLYGVKIDRIDIDIGVSQNIQPPIPAVKIRLQVEGNATLKLGGFPFADISVTGNALALEAGVRRNVDGSFSAATWVNGEPINIDVNWAAAVAAGVVSYGLLAFGAEEAAKYIQIELNDKIVQRFHDVLQSVMSGVPLILAIILGADFTYRDMRLAGNDIVFDYIAPLEPDPKPSPDYLGVIGRSAMQLGPDLWQMMPRSLGDTWSVPNLQEKIDHIVMVMMENRSFDHVLGYLAQVSGVDSDGLTTELTSLLEAQGFPIAKLNQSGIVPNTLGLKTKFPVSVGHHLADVVQQLSERLVDAAGRTILSPKGFVDNFTPRTSGAILPTDVLGYYEVTDLPFTHFLAENYSRCERFFSSHPGPTLPNRMYWLSGDVQYDRTGEAIVDNNSGDNIALSRAMTIFDLLTRKGVPWRVYESPPSVAMLRMFARYATDDTNIVPISRLQQDVTTGNLPAVTVIEPAMHHVPQNDDHPVADMYDGQLFLLNGVYDTLRSNDALWRKTMMIITYDEHGGFYDHVLPPIADIRTVPMMMSDGGPPGLGSFTASTLVTTYGVRVPAFVVSPWTPAGKGPDIVLDHCSMQKTILARFCGPSKPFVSDRVNASATFDAYLSEPAARMNVPAPDALPPLHPKGRRGVRGRSIQTAPVSRRQMIRGDADFHELTGMVARLLGR